MTVRMKRIFTATVARFTFLAALTALQESSPSLLNLLKAWAGPKLRIYRTSKPLMPSGARGDSSHPMGSVKIRRPAICILLFRTASARVLMFSLKHRSHASFLMPQRQQLALRSGQTLSFTMPREKTLPSKSKPSKPRSLSWLLVELLVRQLCWRGLD